MQCVDRFEKYKDEPFDLLILKIKTGEIKSGRYANLVKIKKDVKMKGKEFFNEDSKSE